MIEPFAKAGIETWVAPGDANWNEVYPIARTALWNIQGFIRDGQRLGSTGAINTVWNDDGEGLFNQDWYGVLFGPVASWQAGESPIPDYQDAYGPVFHGDSTGKINEAEKELMAAQEALGKANSGFSSDVFSGLTRGAPRGRKFRQSCCRWRGSAPARRARHRSAGPGASGQPRTERADALTAMDLGARRLDLIGMKFELAQEIADSYAKAVQNQHDKSRSDRPQTSLGEISGNNGRCQDLRDAYSAVKAEYSQVWLSENRPYWLNNVTVRYDLRLKNGSKRGAVFEEGRRDWGHGKGLARGLVAWSSGRDWFTGSQPGQRRPLGPCCGAASRPSPRITKMDTLTPNFRLHPCAGDAH
jgi:hexosaminidase